MDLNNICIIIPTYNNEKTLKQVVDNSLQIIESIIVINDGSTDKTSSIIKSYENKIHSIEYERNKGKGYALKKGFDLAYHLGFDYGITIDSDNQHNTEEINNFIEAIKDEEEDILVLGIRKLYHDNMSKGSTFANKFSNFWYKIQTGNNVKDTQCGFRMYPIRKLAGMFLFSNRYESELEILVRLTWVNCKVKSIPISVNYPSKEERVSHFRPFKDFFRISVLNTILCFVAVFYGYPRLFLSKFLKLFTHKKGKKRLIPVTFKNLILGIYAFTFFLLGSIFLTLAGFILLTILPRTDRNKLIFHKLLRGILRISVFGLPMVKTKIENLHNETFEKPAIIIANHQSHLDLAVMLMFHPKLVILTNKWVWDSPFYGLIVKYADFFPVANGIEDGVEKLQKMVEKGYSIVVFPEGTRSADGKIARFHKGCFYLAEKFQLDILPIVMHGVGNALTKQEFLLRNSKITIAIQERIKPSNNYIEISKYCRNLIKNTYIELVKTNETPSYFYHFILKQFAYKNCFIKYKARKELRKIIKNSSLILDLPDTGNILITNCGIGIFTYMAALVKKDLIIYAHTENKKHFSLVRDISNAKNLHYVQNIDFEKNYKSIINLGNER